MKIKLSDLMRDTCSRCGAELCYAGLWFEDWLGNRYCSYRCKYLTLEKEKEKVGSTITISDANDFTTTKEKITKAEKILKGKGKIWTDRHEYKGEVYWTNDKKPVAELIRNELFII